MYSKIVTGAFFLFFRLVILQAQTSDNETFSGLKSAGPLPEDFTILSTIKFEEAKLHIASTTAHEKNVEENFLLESTFLMDDILQSGKVIFGDPVTLYLNKVKDIILKDDPFVRDQVRIYTLLSNEANAYTADNGIILVTSGLIAEVENEAQIAFILCHEFSHYIRQHALNKYMESSDIDRHANITGGLRGKEIVLAKFQYSRELETEADSLGLELFSKTNYSFEDAKGVFDVLLYSYLPFDEEEFMRDFFNEGNYILPEKYFLDTLSSIIAVEDYVDEESSHPNIKKRRLAMLGAVKDHNDAGRNSFVLSESEFNAIQKLCRFQGCKISLAEQKYEEAIYSSFLLLQKDSADQFLEKVTAQALYGMSMYVNSDIWPEGHLYYKLVEGNIQQVHFLMYKIPKKELNVLALKHAWKSHLSDPENTMMSKICQQLAYELVNVNNTDIKEFYIKNPTKIIPAMSDTSSIIIEEVGSEAETKKNKYQKLKSEPEEIFEKKIEIEDDYWKFAFLSYMGDQNFINLLDAKKMFTENNESTQKTSSRKPQFHLRLRDIVLVDPQLLKIDNRKQMPVLFLESEKDQLEVSEIIHEEAQDINLHIKHLTYDSLRSSDTETFNDLAVLNLWLAEKIFYLDKSMDVINSTNDEFYELGVKYDIDNFLWLGILELREPETMVGVKIFLSFIFPVAPFYLYQLLEPNKYTYFYSVVANSKTGKTTLAYNEIYKPNDVKTFEYRNIIYILDQIRN